MKNQERESMYCWIHHTHSSNETKELMKGLRLPLKLIASGKGIIPEFHLEEPYSASRR